MERWEIKQYDGGNRRLEKNEMAVKKMNVEQLPGLNEFQMDDERAHIKVNKEVCRTCAAKPCTYACPAGLYAEKEGDISFAAGNSGSGAAPG